MFPCFSTCAAVGVSIPVVKPPVPTTNSRMPFAASTVPSGVCGANRSYQVRCPLSTISTPAAYSRSQIGFLDGVLDAAPELMSGRWNTAIVHVDDIVAANVLAAQFLESFKEFPPRQEAATFSIDQVVAKLETALASGQ